MIGSGASSSRCVRCATKGLGTSPLARVRTRSCERGSTD
jgi:hypothetical protein